MVSEGLERAEKRNRLQFMYQFLLDMDNSNTSTLVPRQSLIDNNGLDVTRSLHNTERSTKAMDAAAEMGDLETVMRLNDSNELFSRSALYLTIKNQHLEVFIYLFEASLQRKDDFMDIEFVFSLLHLACSRGLLTFVKFFNKRGVPFTEQAMLNAAANGHLELVKFVIDNYPDSKFSDEALVAAAENNHLKLVEYFCQSFSCNTVKAIDMAAANGHLKIIKFLYENSNDRCTPYAFEQSRFNNHVEVNNFLTETSPSLLSVHTLSIEHLFKFSHIHELDIFDLEDINDEYVIKEELIKRLTSFIEIRDHNKLCERQKEILEKAKESVKFENENLLKKEENHKKEMELVNQGFQEMQQQSENEKKEIQDHVNEQFGNLENVVVQLLEKDQQKILQLQKNISQCENKLSLLEKNEKETNLLLEKFAKQLAIQNEREFQQQQQTKQTKLSEYFQLFSNLAVSVVLLAVIVKYGNCFTI